MHVQMRGEKTCTNGKGKSTVSTKFGSSPQNKIKLGSDTQ